MLRSRSLRLEAQKVSAEHKKCYDLTNKSKSSFKESILFLGMTPKVISKFRSLLSIYSVSFANTSLTSFVPP